jgi:hypothetical protein
LHGIGVHHSAGRERDGSARRRPPESLATLQRSLGNRGMGRLLQRDPKDPLVTHLEAFVAAIPGTPAPGAAVVLADPLPKPVAEVLAAAKAKGDRAKAEKRLKELYGALKANEQALLRDWLSFLYERASVQWPKGATDDEAKAAARVFKALGGQVAFLKWALRAVGDVDFAALSLPAPANVHIVDVDEKKRPAPAKTVAVGSGKVNVFIDIAYRLPKFSDAKSHGISLSYEGSDAQDMRWLQFIWREVVPDGGKAVTGTVKHQKSQYELTTQPGEPSQIHYNTDTAAYNGGDPKSGFYELENSVNRSSDRLEIFDEPSSPYDSMVKQAFAGSSGGVTGRAHLIDYLVKGREVLFRSEIVFEYVYKSVSDNPPPKPKLISAGKASALDPLQRARLRQQFPKLDFLP